MPVPNTVLMVALMVSDPTLTPVTIPVVELTVECAPVSVQITEQGVVAPFEYKQAALKLTAPPTIPFPDAGVTVMVESVGPAAPNVAVAVPNTVLIVAVMVSVPVLVPVTTPVVVFMVECAPVSVQATVQGLGTVSDRLA